jgi:hypothetical protein
MPMDVLVATDTDRPDRPFRLDRAAPAALKHGRGGRVRHWRQIGLPEEIRWQGLVPPQTEQIASAPL